MRASAVHWLLTTVLFAFPMCISSFGGDTGPNANESHKVCTDLLREELLRCPEISAGKHTARNVRFDFERQTPGTFLETQRSLWTAPFRVRLQDTNALLAVGVVAGGVIASDSAIQVEIPTSGTTIGRADKVSKYGTAAFAGLATGSYLFGIATGNAKLRETGWMAGEAALNSVGTTLVLKNVIRRQGPEQRSSGYSFPSSHSAAAFSIATVFASQYPGLATKLLVYGGASAVAASRVIGHQHFTSDVLFGSALGWYMGRRTVQSHEQLDAKMWGTFQKENRQSKREVSKMGSPYVPLDSWTYDAFDRLRALGYIRSGVLGTKPWTRMECAALVAEAMESAEAANDEPSRTIAESLQREFLFEAQLATTSKANVALQLESIYSRVTNVSGPVLNDSYHFGQTLYNDYGRPYQEGFNAVTGFSARATAGPLFFYFRGEYQHSPFAPAYSEEVRNVIAEADRNPVQPATPFNSLNRFRVLDGYVGFKFWKYQLSAGRQSMWWGPARGSSLMMSNNAASMPMVRLTRTEPLRFPGVLKHLGQWSYDSYFGRLEGHKFPALPWTYGQKVTWKPSQYLEFGFSRTTVFAGQGLTPLTWGNFLNSYFSLISEEKGTRTDPGDRRGGVNFSYQLPGLRKWLTVYAEGLVDDDPSPLAAPRRAAWNPGIYLSHVPGLPKLDFRAEAVYTDVPSGRSVDGQFIYWEFINHDSYMNDGNILGSWIGREAKGYQGSTTYWFSARKKLHLSYRNFQVAQDFIPRGVTVHDGSAKFDYTFKDRWSLASTLQYEHLNAPLLKIDQRSNITASIQLTYWPKWGLEKK